jgi:hypothetical protein
MSKEAQEDHLYSVMNDLNQGVKLKVNIQDFCLLFPKEKPDRHLLGAVEQFNDTQNKFIRWCKSKCIKHEDLGCGRFILELPLIHRDVKAVERLTPDESDELEWLCEKQKSHTRWLSQAEYERIGQLQHKSCGV